MINGLCWQSDGENCREHVFLRLDLTLTTENRDSWRQFAVNHADMDLASPSVGRRNLVLTEDDGLAV